ncbi:hypothetical protein [Amycolatopsis sp. NPDC054798]
MNEEIDIEKEALENAAPSIDAFTVVEAEELPAALIQYSGQMSY